MRIVEQVQSRQPIEDMRVEAKAEWIHHARAARRIAAHANTAHGEEILWLIGLDELRGVVGADAAEFSSWWSAVRACFDELAPICIHHLNVAVDESIIVALVFETDRAPFVVKNPEFGKPAGGPVSLEVPWREGTATRSARRSELLRLLSVLQRLPNVEVLSGTLRSHTDRTEDERLSTGLSVSLKLYVVPRARRRLSFHFISARAGLSWAVGWTGPFSRSFGSLRITHRCFGAHVSHPEIFPTRSTPLIPRFL